MVIKRNYTIPLRKEFQKAPKYRRSKKAVTGVIDFLKQHMKSDNIKIGKHLNERIWENGIRNPPAKIEVVAIKDDEGVVKVELIGFEKELEAKPAKAEKAKTAKDTKSKEKAAETIEDAVEKTEETKEAPKAEAKASPSKTEAKKAKPKAKDSE